MCQHEKGDGVEEPWFFFMAGLSLNLNIEDS
jgi:hypothetical protein